MMGLMSLDVIVEPDDRGRVSLAKIPGRNADRYVGRRLSDGAVILQPAVVMTYQSLTSLSAVIRNRATGRMQGEPRSLTDVLDRFGRPPLDEALINEVRADLARRRAAGARRLSDITPEEMASLRAAQTEHGTA